MLATARFSFKSITTPTYKRQESVVLGYIPANPRMLYCHPGFLHTNEMSKIHFNLFALKINVTFLAFTFILYFNTLNTYPKFFFSHFETFQKLTKL